MVGNQFDSAALLLYYHHMIWINTIQSGQNRDDQCWKRWPRIVNTLGSVQEKKSGDCCSTKSSLLIKMTSKLKVAQTRPSKLWTLQISDLELWNIFRGMFWWQNLMETPRWKSGGKCLVWLGGDQFTSINYQQRRQAEYRAIRNLPLEDGRQMFEIFPRLASLRIRWYSEVGQSRVSKCEG